MESGKPDMKINVDLGPLFQFLLWLGKLVGWVK